MSIWEMSKDPKTGRVHRYDLDCLCDGCELIKRRNETHRESKVGRKSYRGSKHNRNAGKQARDNLIVKEKRSKPDWAQYKKDGKDALEET